MTRTRNRLSAKKAGTTFETLIANYLAKHVANHIERRTRNGTKDRGDISGLRHMNQRVVVEVKNHGGQIKAGEWLGEAEIERRNDDAGVAIVVAKRYNRAQPGDQLVIMTVDDLVALLTGWRPNEVHPSIAVTSPEADPWAEAECTCEERDPSMEHVFSCPRYRDRDPFVPPVLGGPYAFDPGVER